MPITPYIISPGTMVDQDNGVKKFLEDIGMGLHWDIFQAKGFDRETDLLYLDHDDLDIMDIPSEDRPQILTAAADFQVTPEFQFRMWLEEQGLGYYYENFRQNYYTDLQTVEKLQLTEDIFDDLEMTVPGHKKRLKRAVNQLCKRRRTEVEDPEARGYWGKPRPLENARNDFLCVQGQISSTREEHKSVQLEFMVDSGSDVVTVREDVLERLDLEQITTARSHGIHVTREKPLYKGRLRLGKTEIDTEVVPETYDSIGNQVIRNFRHYIDGHRHLWLRGNLKVPPPSAYELRRVPSLPPSPGNGTGIPIVAPTDQPVASTSTAPIPPTLAPSTVTTYSSGEDPGSSVKPPERTEKHTELATHTPPISSSPESTVTPAPLTAQDEPDSPEETGEGTDS